MSPRVSVLMPNYNCEQYIAEAIESILRQSFTDFEFIIIDDCSTDHSWDIIQRYAEKDTRIIAIKNARNLGVQHTRNALFANAQGEYYALFDSDDISLKERLMQQVDFLDTHRDIAMLGTNFDIINHLGEVTARKYFPETNSEIRSAFFYRNPFGQNTILMRSECIQEVGVYDPQYAVAEDLDLWIRIGAKYKMHNLQARLVLYRVHGSNSIIMRQKEMIRNALKIRREAVRLGYKSGIKGKFFYIGNWFMQFLPSKFVLWLFNLLF